MTRATSTVSGQGEENGLTTGTPLSTKSRVFRVATVSPWASAVAASSESTTGSARRVHGRPALRDLERHGEDAVPVRLLEAVDPRLECGRPRGVARLGESTA